MKVIDEAKTPSGVKLELVDWSDELPAMHKKSDTIYARPSIDGLQSRLLAFQLASHGIFAGGIRGHAPERNRPPVSQVLE